MKEKERFFKLVCGEKRVEEFPFPVRRHITHALWPFWQTLTEKEKKRAEGAREGWEVSISEKE